MNRENKRFLQTYIWGGKGKKSFFVSTLYRESSAIIPDIWYYETFAWEIDPVTTNRKEWVADNSGAVGEADAFQQHCEVVDQLISNGEYKGIMEDY